MPGLCRNQISGADVQPSHTVRAAGAPAAAAAARRRLARPALLEGLGRGELRRLRAAEDGAEAARERAVGPLSSGVSGGVTDRTTAAGRRR